jgi:hypothetical protein
VDLLAGTQRLRIGRDGKLPSLVGQGQTPLVGTFARKGLFDPDPFRWQDLFDGTPRRQRCLAVHGWQWQANLVDEF